MFALLKFENKSFLVNGIVVVVWTLSKKQTEPAEFLLELKHEIVMAEIKIHDLVVGASYIQHVSRDYNP